MQLVEVVLALDGLLGLEQLLVVLDLVAAHVLEIVVEVAEEGDGQGPLRTEDGVPGLLHHHAVALPDHLPEQLLPLRQGSDGLDKAEDQARIKSLEDLLGLFDLLILVLFVLLLGEVEEEPYLRSGEDGLYDLGIEAVVLKAGVGQRFNSN